MVDKLTKEDNNKKGIKNKRPLFDIVAGTSIGAMKCDYSQQCYQGRQKSEDSKSWSDSAGKLIEFWRSQEHHWPTVADFLDMNLVYHFWWDST